MVGHTADQAPSAQSQLPLTLAWMGVALVIAILTSIAIGASGLGVRDAMRALAFPDGSPESALVWDVRLPRAVLVTFIGANLAIAGVLIQTLTRNPLASPQTFGINAGASLAIVICLVGLPGFSDANTVLPAFVGAAIVGFAMWILSVSGRMNEMKLALAGISIHLVLSSLVQAILIANNAAQDIVYWLAGSVSGAQWDKVATIAPFAVLGTVTAILASGHFGVLALDAGTGSSLGQNNRRVGSMAALLIVCLAGSAVAVSGPIGFIGLLVPHIVRRLVGGDMRAILLTSLLAGPLVLNTADILGRIAAYPAEVPVGVVTALIGAPAFLLLLRAKRPK